MITIYSISYNEERNIQFMIDHYRQRFPSCHIVLYDNMSIDNTVEIALNNNVDVIPYFTNNQLSDKKYMEIKNNCWKSAKTNWVLICDVDELVDINQDQLLYEEKFGTTIIKPDGYNMVNMDDNCDLSAINFGERCERYDKAYVFNKNFITDVNYDPGCHVCNPIGKIVYNKNQYLAYHYNFVDLNLVLQKFTRNHDRLSDENKKNGWGVHYSYSKDTITEIFESIRKNAIKIR